MPDADTNAVLTANRSFYTAFAARDLRAMDAIWSRAVPVACIHPGWPVLAGRDRVLESWGRILGGSAAPQVRCRKERVLFPAPGTALVLCEEVIDNTRLAASNLFVMEEGSWCLAHHQASLLAPSPPEEPEPPRLLH